MAGRKDERKNVGKLDRANPGSVRKSGAGVDKDEVVLCPPLSRNSIQVSTQAILPVQGIPINASGSSAVIRGLNSRGQKVNFTAADRKLCAQHILVPISIR